VRPAEIRVIACGAIAREIGAVARLNGWDHLRVEALPPELHDRPDRIPAAVEERLQQAERDGERAFVGYADCGTGGRLDAVLERYGAERLPGAHCYAVFAGIERFEELSRQEPGTFYLTDFLVRSFERLVIRGLGLDRHPELRDVYFGHYRRVVYLAQQPDAALEAEAAACAARLDLPCHVEPTGLAPFERSLRRRIPLTLSP
jgi:hypothetical protein